jgi:hypothetical protein
MLQVVDRYHIPDLDTECVDASIERETLRRPLPNRQCAACGAQLDRQTCAGHGIRRERRLAGIHAIGKRGDVICVFIKCVNPF